MSKLMMPLFYNGMFNKDGHKMRAALVREVSDGTSTYRLWQGAGKPDVEYPRAQNDTYLLHVEVGDYLAPLRITEFQMIDSCGFPVAVQNLYGGKEERQRRFSDLRTKENADDLIREMIAREQEEITRCGEDPVRQAAYIKAMLDDKVDTYLRAKENDGDSFPDFIGAAVLDDLPTCTALAQKHREKRRKTEEERRRKAAEEEKLFCEGMNAKAEEQISNAILAVKNGGTISNEPVVFYSSQYDRSSTVLVNCLLRRYNIPTPVRTQGWINEKLISITVKDGRCGDLRFWKAKGGRCSEKVWDCLNALVCAILEEGAMAS